MEQPVFREREDGTPLVKICGIVREEDALAAIGSGADALGFNFFEGSKRYLEPTAGIPWIRALPQGVPLVAVVVNPSAELLQTLADAEIFDLIQFHGDESPKICSQSPLPWMKALPASDDVEQQIARYDSRMILLDAVLAAGEYGGGGKVADWNLGARICADCPDRAFFLAGGLGSENVGEAIRMVRPFAVDVASGVESSPGRKDHEKIRRFIAEVRGAKITEQAR